MMFKNKAKLNKFIIIAILLALFFIPTFFAFAQQPKGPGWAGSTVIGVVNFIVGGICYLITLVFSLSLWVVGTIFDWLIAGTTIKGTAMNEIVTAGWVIVRDILNLIFVLALLGIAFATILRIEAYHFKALLPKLLVAALLVNFSKTIALTLIDFSNAIMAGIMGTQNGMTASAALLAMFDVSTFFSLTWKVGEKISMASTDPMVLASNVLVIIFLGMLFMGLAGLAVLLVARIVILMILTVFSPIAFVLNVLPVTQKYASRWWEEFIKYLFVGPVVCICYLLALLFATKYFQSGGIQGLTSSLPAEMRSNVGVSAGTFGQFFGVAIACGLMMVGFTFAKEAAAGMTQAVMGAMKKGLMGAGKLAYGFGAKRYNRSMAKGSKGLPGKLISQLARFGGKDYYKKHGEAFGDVARFASPRVLADMWKQSQAIKDEKAYSGAAGYVHQVYNKTIGRLPGMGKDETDYVRRGQMENVDKHKSNLVRDGQGSREYYLDQLVKSINDGDKDKAEAAYSLLGSQIDENEIANHPELGGMVSKENRGKNNVEFHEELLKNIFGEERAAYIAGNLDVAKRKGGDFDQSGMTVLDPQTGKQRFRTKEEQEKIGAGNWHKASANEAVAAHRTSFVEEEYEYDRDEKTGKPKLDAAGKPIYKGTNKKLSGTFKVLLKGDKDQDGKGVGAGWASQTDRFLRDEARSAITDPKIRKEIQDIIDNEIVGAQDKANAQAFLNACLSIKKEAPSSTSPIITPPAGGKGPRT